MKRFFALSLMLLTINAFSQVPQTMSFQGVLTDPTTGDPIADNNYLMIFRIFDASTAGNEVWTETHDVVVVVNGLYNVILGSEGTVLPTAEFNKPLWLEVQVGTETLAPRFELATSPYALTANSLLSGEHAIPASGNVGIGTTTPAHKLSIAGTTVDVGVATQSNDATGSSYYAAANDLGNIFSWAMGGSTHVSIANKLGLSYLPSGATEGQTLMTIEDSGNVGIGTTDPFRPLHVSGDIADNGVYIRSHNTNPAGWSSFEMRNDASSYRLNFGGSGSAYPNSLYFKDTNLEFPTFLIDPTGKVGIGTTAPFHLLHVQGTSTGGIGAQVENLDATGRSSILLRNDVGHQYSLSVGGSANTRPNSLYIFDNLFGGSRLLLNESGNLGIGTETPASKLEVAGTVTSTGIKMVDGNEATGKVLTSEADGVGSWAFLSKNTLITNIDQDIIDQSPITVPVDAGVWVEVFILSTQVEKLDDNSILEITVLPSLTFDLPSAMGSQVELRLNGTAPDYGFGWSGAMNPLNASQDKTFFFTNLIAGPYTVSYWFYDASITGTVTMTSGGGSNLILVKEIGQ